jgi:hypothetical protein
VRAAEERAPGLRTARIRAKGPVVDGEVVDGGVVDGDVVGKERQDGHLVIESTVVPGEPR